MAEREFTRLEVTGITVAVIVVTMFFYLKILNDPASRRYTRIQRDWVKISSEVKNLRAASAGRSIEREIRRLKTGLKREKENLEKIELTLANGADVDRFSAEVIRTASECGLWVKNYSPVTGEKLRKICREKKHFYERKFYDMVFFGKFTHLLVFLEKISRFPKLVTVETIRMEKTDEEEPLKTTLLLSI